MPDVTARQPYAEQCTRVYTRAGKVAHLLSPAQSIRNGAALCPAGLDWGWDGWRGTGSQAEIDRAASLPVCKRCEDQARREDAYYGESRQFTDPGTGASPVAPGRVTRGAAPRPGDAPPSEPSPPLGSTAGPQAPAPPPSPREAASQGGAVPVGRGVQPRPGGRAVAQAPAGAVPDEKAPSGPAVPAGTTGLSGEEFRKRAREIQVAQARAVRAGKPRYPRKGTGARRGPGMIRRMPPPEKAGGAS